MKKNDIRSALGPVLVVAWCLIAVLFVADRLMLFRGRFLSDLPFFFLLEFYIPPFIALIHAFWAMGFGRGFLFFSLAGFMGTLSELVALRWGAFGSFYVYSLEGPGAGISLQGFPLIVSFYWATFIYIGYWIVSFPFRQACGEPSTGLPGWKALPWMILLDGLCVTAIDLMMDPLQVSMGTWTWSSGGSYYDVPLGNYLGWIVTVCLTTALFRIWETLHPIDLPEGILVWVPHGLYLILFIGFSISAVYLKMPELAMIGLFSMLPFVLWGLCRMRADTNGGDR